MLKVAYCDWCDRQDGKKGFHDSDDEDDDDDEDFDGLFTDGARGGFVKTSQDRLASQTDVRCFFRHSVHPVFDRKQYAEFISDDISSFHASAWLVFLLKCFTKALISKTLEK